ncbi:2Fe-2S iron-sulfur cluster-binding protein [Terrihabitans sp. B22-R8]|uniref:2Fe-2S iron-sulfur cluster-binding protein n=1 Tax=Terrihabitans sp. B22-R8 TaxID=3425128 RepID=UPI00403C1B0B
MSGPSRHPDSRFGRLVDRSKPIGFTFDGRRYRGFAGDMLASALLANGIKIVARSQKFHRPRGIIALGADEPDAFVSLGADDRRTPNSLATQIPLHEGLVAESQNAWPSLRRDPMALLDRVRPLLPAGFQHKTFRWPARAWPFYERLLRRGGGRGRVPDRPDPDRAEHVHLTIDVLIIGGGLAGLAAAEAAAAEGLSVVLAEQDHRLGGIADAYDGRIEGQPVLDWTREKVRALAASPHVHILTGTNAVGLYDHGRAFLVERTAEAYRGPEPENMPRERLWKLRAGAIVLATGAVEKPLVFPDNDRPGLMLAAAARLYLRRYGVVPGARIAIATAGDEGYRTAFDLAEAGVDIARIVDLRLRPDGPLFHIAKARGLPVAPGSAPVATQWQRGQGLTGVTIANRLTFDAPALKSDIACDSLLVSGGWAPQAALAGHLGARLSFDAARGYFRPGRLPPGLFAAGAANACFDLPEALNDGWRAGTEAAAHIHNRPAAPSRFSASVDITRDEPAEAVGMLPDISTPAERNRAFVDLTNDVLVSDIEIALREGYSEPEHLKRYTTLGQGADQGKLALANAAMVVAQLTKTEPAHTGFRPPVTPVAFGTFAGPRRGTLARPARITPVSALMPPLDLETHGGWRLPAAFPSSGEANETAIRREVRAVREHVGLFDASAAVRLALIGPDAKALLNHVSATDLTGIAPGASRHALFLDDNGFVLEDAVVSRLNEAHFIVTGRVGRGAQLAERFERHRRDLRVAVFDQTESLGRLVLAGPSVPALLSNVPCSLDVHALTFGTLTEGTIFETPMQALASHHTGAAEIEIALAAGHLPALWQALLTAGAEIGIQPIGLSSVERVRLEAGAIDLDHEADAATTPFDLGLGHLVAADKTDFLGREALARPALLPADARRVVGLLPEDPGLVLTPGMHLILDADQPPPRRTVGRVTLAGYSPSLRRPIARGLIEPHGPSIGGNAVIIQAGEGKIVRLVDPDFLAGDASS